MRGWSSAHPIFIKKIHEFSPKVFLKPADERIKSKFFIVKIKNLMLNFFLTRPIPVATAVK